MKATVFTILLLVTYLGFSQEEEFIPIDVEGKEAYMSTKTGEYTFLEHAKTDPTQLKTTASGVVYTDISSHTIAKGENLSKIAKKNGVTVNDIKKHNKVASTNLEIGRELKIVKKTLIKSSSPVISYAGEERIIAKLRPGESPGQFAAPPSVETVESEVIETKKTEEKAAAKTYEVDDSNIKNPVLGLGDKKETVKTDVLEDKLETIFEKTKEETVEEKPSQAALLRTAKAEKLRRLKEEAKRLEAELKAEDNTTVTETVVKEREEQKAFIAEEVKEVAKVEAKEKETVAEKATRLVKASKQTQAEIKAKKEKAKVKKVIETEDVAEASEVEKEESAIEYFHTVKKGESFYGIAKKYKMTTKALMALNNAKSTNLDIGQKLKIETPNK